MKFADLINLGSLLVGLVASIIGVQLWRKRLLVQKKDEKIVVLQERLSKLEKFCSTVTSSADVANNVIIIGPRASGKSSIVTLWCEINKLIESISPTVSFNTFDYSLKFKDKVKFMDDAIGVERYRIITKKLKIYDYAGEDNQLKNAVKTISTSDNCTIVMVFNSDIGYSNDNKRYFSRTLVEQINTQFNRSNYQANSVKNVYVVFNKIDLFDNNSNKYNQHLPQLKKTFADNIGNIESIFGLKVNYIVTSAATNHNVLNLLQKIIVSYEN